MVYPTTTQTKDKFHTSDAIPYGMNPTTPDATSFATIKKQMLKNGVSKKSRKQRITAKSVSLQRDWEKGFSASSSLEWVISVCQYQ